MQLGILLFILTGVALTIISVLSMLAVAHVVVKPPAFMNNPRVLLTLGVMITLLSLAGIFFIQDIDISRWSRSSEPNGMGWLSLLFLLGVIPIIAGPILTIMGIRAFMKQANTAASTEQFMQREQKFSQFDRD